MAAPSTYRSPVDVSRTVSLNSFTDEATIQRLGSAERSSSPSFLQLPPPLAHARFLSDVPRSNLQMAPLPTSDPPDEAQYLLAAPSATSLVPDDQADSLVSQHDTGYSSDDTSYSDWEVYSLHDILGDPLEDADPWAVLNGVLGLPGPASATCCPLLSSLAQDRRGVGHDPVDHCPLNPTRGSIRHSLDEAPDEVDTSVFLSSQNEISSPWHASPVTSRTTPEDVRSGQQVAPWDIQLEIPTTEEVQEPCPRAFVSTPVSRTASPTQASATLITQEDARTAGTIPELGHADDAGRVRMEGVMVAVDTSSAPSLDAYLRSSSG